MKLIRMPSWRLAPPSPVCPCSMLHTNTSRGHLTGHFSFLQASGMRVLAGVWSSKLSHYYGAVGWMVSK